MYCVHDGLRTVALNFLLENLIALNSPNTPQITNFAAAQAIDPTRDFTLYWTNIVAQTAPAYQLIVLDAAGQTVFTTGLKQAADTAATISANTLPPGTNLQGILTFANPNLPDTNSYPGAIGLAAMAKNTTFPLVTRPSPARPHLTLLPPVGEQFHFRSDGESNHLYQVLASPDFLAWTNLLSSNSVSGVLEFIDPGSIGLTRRFYRVKVGQ